MEAVFLKILNMSLTASVIIAAVLIVRALLRKAPKKYSYWLWSVVGFRLACPVSWQSVYSLFSLRPLRAAPAQSVETVAGPVAGTSAIEYIPRDIGMMAQPRVNVGIPAVSEAVSQSLPAATPETGMNPMQFWTFMGALVWLIGVAALLVYAVVSYVKLRRGMDTAVRLEGNVYESDRVRSPFILGFLRPKIYIPFGLEGDTLRYVLEHERYHIRRGDYLVKSFAFLLLCVHWFNPLAWLSFWLMGRDMEMSCDEKVLSGERGSAKAYSMALLGFAANRRFPAPSPLAFGESDVKRRIKNALSWKKPKTWVTLAAAVLVLASVTAFAANPAEREIAESGWLADDDAVLVYVMEHYDVNGGRILGGTYRETGSEGDGAAYKKYSVETENGEAYQLTVWGEMRVRRFLSRKTQIGPEFRVTGISYIPVYGADDTRLSRSDGVPAALAAVLRGEREFLFETGETLTVRELAHTLSSDPAVIATAREFTIFDLDRDEAMEAVLALYRNNDDAPTGYLILREQDGDVGGWVLFTRQFSELRDDGTFWFSGSAESNGVGYLEFNPAPYTRVLAGRLEGEAWLRGDRVTEEELEAALAEWEARPYATWYAFSDGSSDPYAAQLALIAANRETWRALDESDGWGYAVTDLDRNGRLEIIATETHGSGHFSADRIFEVSADGRSLVPVLVTELAEGVEMLSQTVPVYYDFAESANLYHYVFKSTVKYGASRYEETLTDLTISGGAATQTILAYKDIFYAESTEITCALWNGVPITVEDYETAARRVFSNCQQGTMYFAWIRDVRLDDLDADSLLARLTYSYANSYVSFDGEPFLTVTSGGVSLAADPTLLYTETWAGDGWVVADGVPWQSAVREHPEQIPTLTLGENFGTYFGGGAIRMNNLKVYAEDLTPLREYMDGNSAVNWLEPGTYYCVIGVHGPQGRYIESEDRYEQSAYNCVFRLTVTEGGPAAYAPAEAYDLTEARLNIRGEDVVLTDAAALEKLENWLRNAEELPGGAACPFGSILYLTRSDGNVFSLCPAEDGCGVVLAGEKYYRYAGGNEEFWAMFTTIWRNQ